MLCAAKPGLMASRPAKVTDSLVSTDFVKSVTRRFSEVASRSRK